MMLSATSGSTNAACLESRSLMMSAAFGDSCLEMDCPPPCHLCASQLLPRVLDDGCVLVPGAARRRPPHCLSFVWSRRRRAEHSPGFLDRSVSAVQKDRGVTVVPGRVRLTPNRLPQGKPRHASACGGLLLARHGYIGGGAAGGTGIRTQLVRDRTCYSSNRV